jgi:ribosomal peptide maturation radical SAM protein 1
MKKIQNLCSSEKIVLLSMPWSEIGQPSAALGILSAICKEEKIPAATLYPALDMGVLSGPDLVYTMAHNDDFFGLGEHLFACDLFGANTLNSDQFIEAFYKEAPASAESAPQMSRMKQIRDEVVPAFLDRAQKRVLDEKPTVVGFTAPFNQVMASLALARRLKRACPEIQIIVGGACFDSEMGREYHRSFGDILDHVFLGEADESFREYLRRRRAGESCRGIPGVTYWEAGQVQCIPGQPLADLNLSPMPDYDGYFAEKERLKQEYGMDFFVNYLPFESSRGCWWGQKQHCVFCGLNEELIKFREKDVERVVSEIISLSRKYRTISLLATDWILSRKSRRSIFQRLRDYHVDIQLTYATRSDMPKEEIALMKEAGVVTLVPGIESFSTELLRLMGKATTGIRQVQFLRWCNEYGLYPLYLILSEFAGDKAEWYLDMASFLPHLFHLEPPFINLHRLKLYRFSPLFEKRDTFGVKEWQIRKDYRCNFPPGFIDLKKIAYVMAYSNSRITPKEEYEQPLREAITRWRAAHKSASPPVYNYRIGNGFLFITDSRSGETTCWNLEGLHKDIVLLADRIQSVNSLKKLLAPVYPAEVTDGRVEEAVEELVREDVLMQEGELVLSLPIGVKPRTTKELYEHVLARSLSEEEVSSMTGNLK